MMMMMPTMRKAAGTTLLSHPLPLACYCDSTAKRNSRITTRSRYRMNTVAKGRARHENRTAQSHVFGWHGEWVFSSFSSFQLLFMETKQKHNTRCEWQAGGEGGRGSILLSFVDIILLGICVITTTTVPPPVRESAPSVGIFVAIRQPTRTLSFVAMLCAHTCNHFSNLLIVLLLKISWPPIFGHCSVCLSSIPCSPFNSSIHLILFRLFHTFRNTQRLLLRKSFYCCCFKRTIIGFNCRAQITEQTWKGPIAKQLECSKQLNLIGPRRTLLVVRF